jgi:Zinc-binding dehydrogenase
LTDGRGVDCIVEIGGPGTIARSLKALAAGGHVNLIGASLSPAGTMLDPLLLTGRGITVGAISVGSRADFEAMNRAIAMHRLRPAIDRTFPFAEAKAAYRHFEGRGKFGEGRDRARLIVSGCGCILRSCPVAISVAISRGRRIRASKTTDLGVRGSTPLGRAVFRQLRHQKRLLTSKPEADRKQRLLPRPSSLPSRARPRTGPPAQPRIGHRDPRPSA